MYKMALSTMLSFEIVPITKDGKRLTFYKTWARFHLGKKYEKELLKK